MTKPFSLDEMEVVSVIPATPRSLEIEQFKFPVSEKQAFHNTLDHKPDWVLIGSECQHFTPAVIPDNVARGMVIEALPFDPKTQAGGADMFGINWVYVPVAGGSMEEVTDEHLLTDANDWRERITFPDVDSWDWEGCAQRNKDFISNEKYVKTFILTGWFERLISFMGFEDAAVAMIDEDQTEALAELMLALSDTYVDIVDHLIKYFPQTDVICVHDDWGSQQGPFFSAETAARIIVPAMKKVTDRIKQHGRRAELHSCGNHGSIQIENIIAAGWECWQPQPMNDVESLFAMYGDKITFYTYVGNITADMSDDEMEAAAQRFVDTYCTTPGKSIFVFKSEMAKTHKAYRRALYRKSREAYSSWNL